MSRNVRTNKNGKFSKNSPKVCSKFKDVQKGPLKSSNFDENGEYDENNEFGENSLKVKQKF